VTVEPIAVDAVLTCPELEPVLDHFRRPGFALDMIMPADDPAAALLRGGGELQFWFVLAGSPRLTLPDHPGELLGTGDAVAVPAGVAHGLVVDDAGCELLEVTLPDRPRHNSA
jgi:mannose-6-phosphate isomerase-like protein (cupin superfamily)